MAFKLAARGHSGIFTELSELYIALMVTDFRVDEATLGSLKTYFANFDKGIGQAIALGELAAPILVTNENAFRNTTLLGKMFEIVFGPGFDPRLLATVAANAMRTTLRKTLEGGASKQLRDAIAFGDTIDGAIQTKEAVIRRTIGDFFEIVRIWEELR